MSTNRKQWAAMLGKLTAPMSAVEAAKAIADMLPLLADLPDEAFTLASLEHVAGLSRRVPTYAELRAELGAWWRDHRPTPPEIAGPANDQWSQRVTAEHAQAVKDWADPVIVRSAIRSLIDHPMRAVLGPMLGGLIGRHAPDNLGMLPPEWITASSEEGSRGESRLKVKPRHLSPEQLAILKAPRPAA